MIVVKRPEQAPAVLNGRGKEAAKAMCTDHESAPDAYHKGERNFDPDSSIYAHVSVRLALREAQHDKCAFCECKFSHQQYGDVEHYRPKRGYKQKESDRLGRPGYYWLAYDWTNLLLSCVICNQRFKKNLFPLKVPTQRCLSHKGDLSVEQPLLIDPSRDKPSQYLEFHEDLYKAVANNPRGRETISIYGLNREELAEDRRSTFAMLAAIKDCRELLAVQPSSPEVVQSLKKLDALIAEKINDSAEYTAMARSLFYGPSCWR